MPISSKHKEEISCRLAEYASEHRQAPTNSEAKLWRAVRASQLGARVRRQEVLEGFIVDFFVPTKKLVIEVDGGYHAKRIAADATEISRLGLGPAQNLKTHAGPPRPA